MIAAATLSACGKGGGSDDTKWPDKPANGAPIAVEFVEMVGTGDDAAANMRIFNFADSPLVNVTMRLHYLDKDGNELDSFPWSMSAPRGIVDGKSHKVKKMGAFVKEGTTTVRAELRDAELKDGTKWAAGT